MREVRSLLVARARLERHCRRGVNQTTSQTMGTIPARNIAPRTGLNAQTTRKLNTRKPAAMMGWNTIWLTTLVIMALS